MDVVIDTDVLSTFAKINRLELLAELFPESEIIITPCVFREIRKGVRLGVVSYSQPKAFTRITLHASEKSLVRKIRKSGKVGFADAECISVARNRSCLLITNDRSAEKQADLLSVEHINLPSLLSELWKSNVMSKRGVAELIKQIELKDRVVIKNKEEIFK